MHFVVQWLAKKKEKEKEIDQDIACGNLEDRSQEELLDLPKEAFRENVDMPVAPFSVL